MESPQNNNDNNPSTTPTLNVSGAGFGTQFKTARERRNLTIDDVVAELNILHRHLDAIERSDFDSLPQAAFTRGFVSSYAKFLKLDVNNVLAHFDSIYPKEKLTISNETTTPVVDNKSLGKVSRNNEGKKANFGRLGGLLLLLGIIGLGAVYVLMSSKESSKQPITSEPTVLEEMEQQQAEAVESDTENKENTEDSVQETTDAKSDKQAEDSHLKHTEVDVKSKEAVVVDPNAKPAELVLWVIKGTEINITDQTGAVLISGKKQRGEHRAKGKPPFKITIAQASNVRLNMNKIPVKLKKYSVNNKADFTLTN